MRRNCAPCSRVSKKHNDVCHDIFSIANDSHHFDVLAALQLSKSASREPELKNEIKALKQQLEGLEDAQTQASRVIEGKQKALDAATAELRELRASGAMKD